MLATPEGQEGERIEEPERQSRPRNSLLISVGRSRWVALFIVEDSSSHTPVAVFGAYASKGEISRSSSWT